MNSKPFLLIAGICTTACLSSLFAQGAGGGGSGGSSAGSAGTGPGGTTAAGAAATSGTTARGSAAATASTTGTTPASTSAAAPAAGTIGSRATTAPVTGASPGTTSASPGATSASAGISADSRAAVQGGTPNTSPTMPDRSVPGPALQNRTGDAPTEQSSLPPGLSAAPTRPGISPLSGLPVSDLPAVSRGTAPLGPRASVPSADGPAAEIEARRRAKAALQINDPAAIAAHPQTNPRIGTGTTVTVPTPPPAAQLESVPPSTQNDAGQTWVGGHYSWVGGQWQWVAGSWQRPPQAGATWIPGNYDATTKRWTEGHWDTRR